MAKKNAGGSADALLAALSGKRKGRKAKAKGLPSRTGRRAAKYTAYYATTNKARKLRHLLKRNGLRAAQAWAESHDAEGVLKRLG
jgi:hypothetical protein